MSKIRIIWQSRHGIYYGQTAFKQLDAYAKNYFSSQVLQGLAISPRWKHAVAVEKRLRLEKVLGTDSELRIYREPRQVNAKNSRYKRTLNTLGMPVPGWAATTRRGGRGGNPLRPPAPGAAHPKKQRASRTVTLLERELMNKMDGDF